MQRGEDTTQREGQELQVCPQPTLSAVPRCVLAPPQAHAPEGGHAPWEENEMTW